MKDIKYIIKRVIIGILIAVILSLLGKYSVIAEELGSIQAINTYNTFGSIQVKIEGLAGAADFYETPLASNTLTNYGKGFFIFSFAYYSDKNIGASGSLYSSVIHSVSVKSGSAIYSCEIGNLEPYSDSGVQWKQASAKCYVNFGSNGLERLRFQTPYQPSNSTTYIIISRYATFVGASTPTSNQNVVNAIQQQTQQQQTIITQNETMITNQQTMIQEQQETNDLINSDDTTAAESKADDFINSINTTDSTGLSGIITAPLRMITNLNNSCQPISLTIPYINKPLIIPCMSTSIYPKFSGLTTTIAIVINGFLIYRVIASLYYMVKGFKDPENDKVEVMDL